MPPRSSLNKKLFFAITGACLIAASHHGYHMGVLNIPQKPIRNWTSTMTNAAVDEERSAASWTGVVSTFPGGAFIGSFFTNLKFGPKKILFYTSFITIGGQSLLNMSREAYSFSMMIFGRLILGITAGLFAGVAPLFLWEVSPKEWRKIVVMFFQTFISFSMVMGQIFGLVIPGELWIIILMLDTIPTAFGTLIMKFCPESPVYIFMGKQNEIKTLTHLVWYRNSLEVTEFVDELKREQHLIQSSPEVTFRNIWSKTLLCCFMVIVCEQLCGISVFVYHSSEILMNMGVDETLSHCVTLAMGFMMMAGTVTALLLVEYLKPKVLLLISLGLIFFISVVLTVIFLVYIESEKPAWVHPTLFVAVVAFGFCYGLGVGPVRWLMIVESYNFASRGLVAALVLPVHFLTNFIIVWHFLGLKLTQRYYFFVVFSFFDLVFFVYIYCCMPIKPETKPNS